MIMDVKYRSDVWEKISYTFQLPPAELIGAWFLYPDALLDTN